MLFSDIITLVTVVEGVQLQSRNLLNRFIVQDEFSRYRGTGKCGKIISISFKRK